MPTCPKILVEEHSSALLREEWSPEQVVGHLRLHGGDAPEMAISHETIYRSICTTRWKVIPRQLCKRLRTGRPIRKNTRHTGKGQWRSQIIDATPIDERRSTADERSTLGHLEGDLVIGPNNSQVATLVDRKSRFLVIVKLPSRHSTIVAPELIKTYDGLDPRLRDTLTWDRGMELAEHKQCTAATGVDVFFAAPRSPWQRGTNENTVSLGVDRLDWSGRGLGPAARVTLENTGRLKGTNLSTFTQADHDPIATKLNTRPRKCLGFRTPTDTVAFFPRPRGGPRMPVGSLPLLRS